jgi:hypothetical protein
VFTFTSRCLVTASQQWVFLCFRTHILTRFQSLTENPTALRILVPGSTWGPRWVCACVPDVAVLRLCLLCRGRMPCLFPYERGPCVMQEKHGGSAVQQWWKTPAQIRHRLGRAVNWLRDSTASWSPNRSSVAPIVSSYVASLGTLCTSEALPEGR